MSIGNTRKGFTQATFNEDASNFLIGEILIASIVGGAFFESWYIFGGMLVGLLILFVIPLINIILSIFFSLLWAVIGAGIVCFYQDINLNLETNISIDLVTVLFSTPASQILGGILFLSGLGMHMAGIEWVRDVSDHEDRNI
jgi:hypothetical protein